VYGELDMDSAESFREQLSAALCEPWGKSFLIDLSGVTFMDSSGLRALRKALDLGGGKDLIVQTSRQVFKSSRPPAAEHRGTSTSMSSRHKPVLISC